MSTFVSGCLSPESPVAVEASLKLTREAGICFARLWKKKQTENVMFSATSGHWLGFRSSGELAIGPPVFISQISRSVLFSTGTRSSAAENVVQSDGAGAEEDQSKSQRGRRQGELHSVIAGQPIVQVHFPDRDDEIYADGESRDPGKESRQNEEAAQELREGRNVAHPLGQTKTRHEFGVLMQASENFVVAMHDHNGAEGETHEKKRKWLQAFRVAQGDLRLLTRLPQTRLQQKSGAA